MNYIAGKPPAVRPARRSKKPNHKGASAAPLDPVEQGEIQDLSLAEQAYHQLEELITTLALPPGTVLAEQGLAQRLQIGRTPIREALQRLARDGLVVVIPRRGILVSEINLRTQLRLLETRRVLEHLIARLAAERATAEERRAFAEIAANMRAAADAADDIAFMRLDRQFNELAAAASRNEFAVRSLNSMAALSRRFWYQHYKEAADLPLAANLHAEVCEAIAKRDVKAAGEASDRLMDYIDSFARKTLDT
ncbi:GntR family transcriptional regulator [Methylobacterium nodulans]|uniref:Transcriptional regulator, GntR family n=1 Tax=Methylobacterium nodulans (strain LMG 21967 / CNCM I-2342 / ORS 2060) TaxID=460265 RepID=B8IX05_METNO|nr:GntR family transcriptional regulator [Methylobacterium nodulans]ACL63046.1 transcriptional regulator, GntR family [Methylobacterium nodulans ORS 2060]